MNMQESLGECKKILMLAKAGKKTACLIEGMASRGCVAGAGTNIPSMKAAKELQTFKNTTGEKKLPDKDIEEFH